jgi:hypothetical protein
MSEVQRLALVRVLSSRLPALELDALRLLDHIVTRLELGRQRYGDLDLAAPRDWGKELGEELVDALVYHTARELAAQDMARESLREAARREMLLGEVYRDAIADTEIAAAAARLRIGTPRQPRTDREFGDPDLAIAVEPGPVAEFASDAHLTRVSTEPARIAATPEASGGEPYEEIELGGEGG